MLAYLQQHWQVVRLRANSIGAYFSMLAFAGATIEKALFVSPIVDMERLICDMMQWAKVTPEQLCEKGEITTEFGQTLNQMLGAGLPYSTAGIVPIFNS